MLHPKGAHSKTCTHHIYARLHILTLNSQCPIHFLTKWNWQALSLVVCLKRISKALTHLLTLSSLCSKQFVRHKHLKICCTSLGVYSILAFADTTCNLKSWVWWSKVLAITTSNFLFPKLYKQRMIFKENLHCGGVMMGDP